MGHYVFKSLHEVEPIWAYLHKSGVYVIALYTGQHLIGCMLDYYKNPISLKSLSQSMEDLFPKDINDIDAFIEKNQGRVSYYSETSICYYDDDNNIIKDKVPNKLSLRRKSPYPPFDLMDKMHKRRPLKWNKNNLALNKNKQDGD